MAKDMYNKTSYQAISNISVSHVYCCSKADNILQKQGVKDS